MLNVRSRKCDSRHVGQFGRLQNYSNFGPKKNKNRPKILIPLVSKLRSASIYSYLNNLRLALKNYLNISLADMVESA